MQGAQVEEVAAQLVVFQEAEAPLFDLLRYHPFKGSSDQYALFLPRDTLAPRHLRFGVGEFDGVVPGGETS